MCNTSLRVGWGLSISWEIVPTEVKGRITKNSVPKEEDSQENKCILEHSTRYSSGYNLNIFLFFRIHSNCVCVCVCVCVCICVCKHLQNDS
jgi:hypothetical protein